MPDFVPMAHLWQRHGFMNMRERFQMALFSGFQTPPVADPPADSMPASERFIATCERWIREAGLSEDQTGWSRVSDLVPKVLVSQPGYRPTIADVEWDLADFGGASVRLRAQVLEDVRLLWQYENYAFGVFWALFYHIENEYLRRPKVIAMEIANHTVIWSLAGNVMENGLGVSVPAFALALYERLLGMYADQALGRQHHLGNIVNRQGLSVVEQQERPELFQKAIAYLLQDTLRRDILPQLDL